MSVECMNKYKNDFAIKFAQIMGKNIIKWKNTQIKHIKYLYLSPVSWTIYLVLFLGGFIPGKREHNYDFILHCWMAVGCLITAIIFNIQLANKNFQNEIKVSLFPMLLKTFGKDIYYRTESSSANVNYHIPDLIFENSELYSRQITYRTSDDGFYANYNNVELKMNETEFGWNSKDKNKTNHKMFKGIAMHFKMNKEIKSRVLILSKFSGTNIPEGYEKVNLEYEKFSKKYDVWARGGTNGQIEARYLLNTAFLDRFMQIQTSFRVQKMCASVFGNDMLIMLSTGKDLFEMNHLFGKIDDTKQYNHLFDEFASILSFIDILNLSSRTRL